MAGLPDEVDEMIRHLEGKYDISHGPPVEFLGVRIARGEQGVIQIGQEKAIMELLKRNRMQDCKPKKVIATNHPQMTVKLDEPEVQGKELAERIQQYRALIGSLLHLAVWTRPDLSFVVGMLARHCSNPGVVHLTALKSILRYLQGTKNNTITYGMWNTDNRLIAFCDADFAGDVTGAKSTSASILMMNGGVIAYQSRRQTIVALSTTEAELIALCECIRTVITMRNKLEEVGFTQPPRTPVFMDNQTAIHLAHQNTNGPRTKHFNVRLKFVREHIAMKTVEVQYVDTHHNMSDLLTKLLSAEKTQHFRESICGNMDMNLMD